MIRTSILGLITVLFLSSCGDSSNTTANNSADTATSEQSNAAEAPANDHTTSNNSITGGSFKEVMDKMMQDMHSMKMTNDPDHDFAMMMKSHHQGAIEMANIELSKGANAELKQVAQKIIDDSQKDINDLNAFLGSHQPSKNSEFAKKQMDKMMKSMDMNMDHGGDIDKEFAMMMTMHHQHGIDMARDYLKVGTAAETKKVANNTIKANSEDIKKLKAHGGSAGHSGHDMSETDKKETKKAAPKKEAEKVDHSKHQ